MMIDTDCRQEIKILELSMTEDNSGMDVSGYWEQNPEYESERKNRDVLTPVRDLVKKANDSIYLYSPKITDPDLQVILQKKKEEGVRVYALTSSLEPHRNLFSKIGIMREKEDINSTLVFSDPKQEASKGIWYSGELSSRQAQIPFFLKLTKEQIIESQAHFSHFFWQANGSELYFGGLRPAREIRLKTPEIKAVLPSSFRTEGLDDIIGSDEIYEMWIPEGFPDEMSIYLPDAKRYVVEIGEYAKSIVSGTCGSETEIYGEKAIPFSHIATSGHSIIFSQDLGFVLSPEQEILLQRIFQRWKWKFKGPSKLSDIKSPVVLFEDTWDDPKIKKVCESTDITLSPIEAPTLKDWMNKNPGPEIPISRILSLQLVYQWELRPPTLPKNASKHRLYKQWETFVNRFKNELESARKVLNSVTENLSEFDSIMKQKDISRLEREINELASIDWSQQAEMSGADKKLSKLKDIFKEIEAITEHQDENNETPDKSENELDVTRKSGNNKKVRREKSQKKCKGTDKTPAEENEIEVSRNHLKASQQEITIPYKSLPSLGSLFEENNNIYLAIRYTDEINTAEEISKKYNAKLVADLR
jgi:hypothetical protein